MYSKLFVIVLFVLLLSNTLFADGPGKPYTRTVIGYVFDSQTKEPLEGAKIKVSGTDMVVYADESGRFIVNCDFTEGVELTINMISYQITSQKIVSVDNPQIINLKEIE